MTPYKNLKNRFILSVPDLHKLGWWKMNTSIIIHENLRENMPIGEYQGIITNTNTIDFINYSIIDYWPDCAQEFRQRYNRVALIDMLKINKDFRGMGYGKKIIERIIKKSKAHGSEAIILMADLHEPNSINLVTWYENHGFNLYIGSGQALPIMIKEI